MEIACKIFPDTIVRDVRRYICDMLGFIANIRIIQYFLRSTSSASDLWHTRKQFILHLSAFIFQTYLFSIGRRTPSSLLINRAGGQMFTSDLVPSHAPGKPEFANTEPVPFRLTPNMQNFITPIGIEGVLVTGVMSIARALTESEVSARKPFESFFLWLIPVYSMIWNTDWLSLFRMRWHFGILVEDLPSLQTYSCVSSLSATWMLCADAQSFSPARWIARR